MSRVLVIDDDELMRRFVVALLERRLYSVQSADCGEAGIKIAEQAVFDLIITDMVLPGVSGLETIKQIRRDKPHIKILAVSGGEGSRGDYLNNALGAGADAILAKPFPPVDFLNVVARLVTPPGQG
jgi:CheY-like chemotaxis protein